MTSLDTAKSWCTSARGILGLTQEQKRELKLKSNASTAVSYIKKLQSKLPTERYEQIEAQFIEVSTRIHAEIGNAERVGLDQIALDSARIAALAMDAKAMSKSSSSSVDKRDEALLALARKLLASEATPQAVGDGLHTLALSGASLALDTRALSLLTVADSGQDAEKVAAQAVLDRLTELRRVALAAVGPSEHRDETGGQRTPNEVLVQLMAAAKRAGAANVVRDVQSRLLRHKLSVAETRALLLDIGGRGDVGELAALSSSLADQIPGRDEDLAPTRLHDNIYGRVIDSSLVSALVETPPPGVLAASRDSGQAFDTFLGDVIANDPAHFAAAADELQHYLLGDESEDPRFWLERVPGLQAVRDADTPAAAQLALRAFLTSDKHTGQDCVAVPWVMVKLSLSLVAQSKADDEMPKDLAGPDLEAWFAGKKDRMHRSAPWMNAANLAYQQVSAQKKNVDASQHRATDAATSTSGITMRHQPAATPEEGYISKSTKPADLNVPDFVRADSVDEDDPGGDIADFGTTAMGQAMTHGHAYASGASGSTNIMLHLVDHLNRQAGAHINTKDFLLSTAMFLVHDGGHSLQEVMYTANMLDGDLGLGIGMGPKGDAGQYVADYESILDAYGDDNPTGQALRAASGRAMDRVATYFEDNSVYAPDA